MTDYVLEILDGDRAGEVIPLGSSPLRIGRRAGNDLVLSDEKVSGQHAELAAEGGAITLRDLGSTNGSFLDGKRIEEVALTAGDVLRIGRVSMRFREADAVAAGAEEFEVNRLDTGRRRKGGSGGVMLLGVAAVAVAGVGAWWQWGRGETPGVGPQKSTAPLQIAGNLIDGAMEELEPWNLEAGGDPFQPGAAAHTGRGAVVARPVDGAGEGAQSSGFALARGKGELTVTGGDALVVGGFVRASGGARGAIRVWLHGTDESSPSLRGGSALTASSGWTECSADVAVPAGCTRATVELLAWFDGPDGEVWIDDVSLTKGGTAEAIESRTDAGPTLVGCRGGAVVRSISAAEPFVVRRIGPLLDGAPGGQGGGRAVGRDRVVTFSDLGASLSGAADGDRISVNVAPGDASGLRLWLPPGAAAQPLVGDSGGFVAVEDRASFRAQRLLIGSGPTRCLLTFAEPQAMSAGTDGDADHLDIPGVFAFDVAVGFQGERQNAQSLLAQARAAWNDGSPGAALAVLDRLSMEVPHDTEVLAQARALRGDMFDVARGQLDEMDAALQNAAFFRTEGGFQRVRDDLQELIARHEPVGPPDAQRVEALRVRTEEALARFASERAEGNRERLARLLAVFEAGGQTSLAQLIKDYLERRGG